MSPGSVPGHILPGTMISALGIYQALGVCRLLLLDRDSRPSRSWYPAPWPHSCACRAAWPFEPVLKCLGATLGFVVEIYAKDFPSLNEARTYWRPLHGDDGHVVPPHVDLWGHATMYLCFVLLGLTELCGVLVLRYRPDDAAANDLARAAALGATALGWGVSCVSMLFHSAGQDGIWSRAHLILALFAGGACAAAVVEVAAVPVGSARYAPIIRTACVILQGTWYLQIASMIGRKDVWVGDHMALHALPVEMNFHLLTVAFSLLATYGLVGLVSAARGGDLGGDDHPDRHRRKIHPSADVLSDDQLLLVAASQAAEGE